VLVHGEGSLYPTTLRGLLVSYEMGVPFFRYTLAGNAFYTGLLFGGLTLAEAGFEQNEEIKKKARADKKKPEGLKREPGWPKAGKLVKSKKPIIDIAPKPFRCLL